ncbi:MAG TPA: hypothetical protein V6D08_12300 [Candidatus Obscuribacterales bacterium]
MPDKTFEVDILGYQSSEKCLVSITTPDGGCCAKCRKPAPFLVFDICPRCAVANGLNPLRAVVAPPPADEK